jgi:hypothetical protein
VCSAGLPSPLAADSAWRHGTRKEEASTLRSALAAALSAAGAPWPAFLPVHDALRDAQWGVALPGRGLRPAFMETDSVHTSSQPQRLRQVHCGAVGPPGAVRPG